MAIGATVTGKISGTVTREGDVLTFTPAKKTKPGITVETENFPGNHSCPSVTNVRNQP